jgi:hypothetical protein
LRRVLAQAPAPAEAASARELWIWNSANLPPDDLADIGRGLGLRVRVCALAADLDLTDGPALPNRPGPDLALPAALARLAGPPAVDFLHSRLAPPKKTWLDRKARWGIAAAAVVLAVTGFMVWNWLSTRSEVARLQGRLADLKSDLREAKEVVDNVTYARPWYDGRPGFLDCLREVTAAFPDTGTIWATSVMVKQEALPEGPPGKGAAPAAKADMQVSLMGKAVNKNAALDVYDKLNANPRLINVKQLYIRQAAGAAREESFAFSFSFHGAN